MKVKVSVLVLFIVLLLSLGISVSAMDMSTIDNGDLVTVNVECGTNNAGAEIFVTIISPAKNVSELPEVSSPTAKEELKQMVNYIGTQVADGNGKISFTYDPGNVSGEYTLRLTGEGIEDVYEEQFTFISDYSRHVLLRELGDKKMEMDTENGIAFVKALFNPNDTAGLSADFEILGLNEAEFYPYYNDNKYCDDVARQEIYSEIWEKIPEMVSNLTGVFENDRRSGAIDVSLDKLKDVFNNTALYSCFESITDGESMGKYVDIYAEKLGMSTTNAYEKIYRNEEIFTDRIKNSTLGMAADADFRSVSHEEIPELFAQYLVLGVFNSIDSYSVADLMVESVSGELEDIGVDIEEYEDLKYPLNACRKLVNLKPFDTLEELAEDFNKAISEQKKDETDKKTPGGGKENTVPGGRDTSLYIPSQGTSYVSTVPESEMNTDVFSDISSVAWAKESIEALAEKGIITGKGNKVFAPNDMVTREEFATMMVRAKEAYDDAAIADFTDCASDEWYYKYVASAVNSGLMNGFGDDFGVGSNITRQDAAVVIWRALGMDESEYTENETYKFSDENKIADYAKIAVSQLRDSGIVSGVSETEFSPLTNLTRAQAAKLIYGMLMFTEVK